MADYNKVVVTQATVKTIINVDKLCRFCLFETKSDITINDKCPSEELRGFEDDSIYDFVTKMKFIKIEDDKCFPSQVCENCYNLVKICSDFSQLCQKSDTFLRNCIENNAIEDEYTEKDATEPKCFLQATDTQETDILNYKSDVLLINKLNVVPNTSILPVNVFKTCKEAVNLVSNEVKKAQPKLTSLSVENKHTCSQCGLNFDSIQALNYHVVNHKKRFQCKKCSKSFSRKDRLKKHYTIIHKTSQSELSDGYLPSKMKVQGKDLYFCTHCNPHKAFRSEDEFTIHLESHKDITQHYVCLFCKDLTFSTQASLNDHVLVVHKLGSLTDLKQTHEVGGKTENVTLDSVVNSLTTQKTKNLGGIKAFKCVDGLEKHINQGVKILKKDGSWYCSKCPASYTRKHTLLCHIKEKHKNVSLEEMKCPEPGCSKCFSTNRQLILHGIIVHRKYFAYFHKVFKKVLQSTDEEENRVKKFECDFCQKRYFYKSSLKKHIFGVHLKNSVKNPVVCSHCGKTLSDKLNLKSHIEFVHQALFVSCPICKKKVNFRGIGKHYKTHKTNMDVVKSKNVFLCNLCGKTLKSKQGFEDHQKLHKNIRDELCDICGSGFTSKKFLRIHKKTHERGARKVFSCNQCDKAFSGRPTLNRHLLTHLGKKNFICEICSKCFYTLPELNRHVRSHKKDYRFSCQLCDMKFLEKSTFRHHMMRHRNVRPHKCQFCEKMFIVRGKMNVHMATKHNVEVESRRAVWKDPKTYVPLDDLL